MNLLSVGQRVRFCIKAHDLGDATGVIVEVDDATLTMFPYLIAVLSPTLKRLMWMQSDSVVPFSQEEEEATSDK